MTDVDKHKRAAILELVCQLLSNAGFENSYGNNVAVPQKYEDLRDGTAFYYILSCIAPSSFPDVKEIIDQMAAGRQNRILRKVNFSTLIRHLDEYAHLELGAPDTVDLSALFNASDIANPPASPADDAEFEVYDRGLVRLTDLSDFFIVVVVLSGHADVMRVVRKLSHADQVMLSNAAKACITKYALSPRRRQDATVSESSHQSSAQAEQPHLSESRQDTIPPLIDESSAGSYAELHIRRELDDAMCRAHNLEAKLEMALSEGREWESKYKQLLNESERRRVAFADEGHLRQLLAKREEMIQTLTTSIAGNAKQISALREANASQEIALAGMKRKLKQTEGELVKKSSERRAALERLTVAEDRLAVQIEARAELEKEMENVRSELALAQVAQCDNVRDDPLLHSYSSLASAGSVDRIVQLENELDEVRSQKEAAERLLHVLQRQVALLPQEEEPKAPNEAEALRTQLREAEREKEELRNHLSATITQLEKAQTAHLQKVENQGAVKSETENFSPTATAARGVSETTNACSGLPADEVDQDPEKSVLASTLVLLGYRNLMLQQRAMLDHWNSNNTGGDVAEQQLQGDVRGSLLTRHRREVEKGLLETVIGRHR